MKTVILLLTFLMLGNFEVSAADNRVVNNNIANSFDALLSDTVNEGDVNASVKRKRGTPVMDCSYVNHRTPGKGVARCDVTLDVVSMLTGEEQRCQASCFLISVYDLKSLKIISTVENLEQSCIEILSSGCD